jgi:hypothetical protein
MVGIGDLHGVEFLAATGGNLEAFTIAACGCPNCAHSP